MLAGRFVKTDKLTQVMAKKLFVGGIPYSSNDDGLRAYFSQAGTVTSAQIMMDRDTGRSRGYGFVEMSSDEEAQNAVAMFNGKQFEGRDLTVNEARPREDRGAGARSGGGYSGGNQRSY